MVSLPVGVGEGEIEVGRMEGLIVIVLDLLISVHCCGPHVLPVNSSTGADKSDGSTTENPKITSTS